MVSICIVGRAVISSEKGQRGIGCLTSACPTNLLVNKPLNHFYDNYKLNNGEGQVIIFPEKKISLKNVQMI